MQKRFKSRRFRANRSQARLLGLPLRLPYLIPKIYIHVVTGRWLPTPSMQQIWRDTMVYILSPFKAYKIRVFKGDYQSTHLAREELCEFIFSEVFFLYRWYKQKGTFQSLVDQHYLQVHYYPRYVVDGMLKRLMKEEASSPKACT